MSYTDPHNHRAEPVSPEEAEQAAAKGLVWDAEIVAFREPETRSEAATVDPDAPIDKPVKVESDRPVRAASKRRR